MKEPQIAERSFDFSTEKVISHATDKQQVGDAKNSGQRETDINNIKGKKVHAPSLPHLQDVKTQWAA